MELQIKSQKLGKTITFSIPGSEYIFADLNGQPGTLGNQICQGGKLTGSAISYGGEDQEQFEKICRNWYRSYLRQESIEQKEVSKMGAKITLVTTAKQAGVSPALLREYAEYVIRKATEHPEAFAADPEAFIDQAVRHYNQQALKFYNEVLSNPTKFSDLATKVESYLQQ